MQKQSLFTALVACLLAVSCTKTDIRQTDIPAVGDKIVSGASNNNTYTYKNCDVIGFTAATAGTLISSVYSDGGAGPIAMTSFNSLFPAQPVAAMVFNSANPPSDNLDLGTPNQAFGGQGVGAGGASGPYVNNQSLGNILFIQDFNRGLQPYDADNAGYVTFDFSAIGPVTVTSLTVLDVETAEGASSSIKLYDQAGGTLLYAANFPITGENGVAVIDLNNTKGVGFVRIDITRSIAIDNLRFCYERKQCTYTQGYWKNHEEAWPVSSLTLGTVSYTKAQLLDILRTPVRGNGLISLAHQLIAAKLNKVNGSNATVINADIAAADALIGSLVVPPVGSGSLSPSQTSYLVDRLTSYNEGRIGPGHCN